MFNPQHQKQKQQTTNQTNKREKRKPHAYYKAQPLYDSIVFTSMVWETV